MRCPAIPNTSYNIEERYLGDQLVRGVKITYECNQGFIRISGSNYTTCTVDGWSENAECVKSKQKTTNKKSLNQNYCFFRVFYKNFKR